MTGPVSAGGGAKRGLGRLRRRPGGRRGPVRPGQLGVAFATPAILVGLVFTLGPVIVIAVFSFLSQPETGGGVVYQFSAEAYRHFLFQEDFVGNTNLDLRYLRSFGLSAFQALATTAVCIGLAFPIALWMTTKTSRVQNLLVLVVTIPFWTNLLVRTYAWILLLSDRGAANAVLEAVGLAPRQLLYNSGATLVGLIYTFLPFAILPIYSALAGFDFSLAEAAYDLGARKSGVIRRVIWPAAAGGVMSAVALCFVPAFGAFVQPVLLGGGKVLMVGNLIAAQYGEARNWPFGAALSVIILVLTLLGAFALLRLAKRSSQKVSLAI
ncbi:MAG: ABC transporter permease [Bifidobacteriaceae bacterium]|jgi:spermidine/putrescine transport system permease protein|nr:ABC transporter permease [Bifidobacteriaceae bacterium]